MKANHLVSNESGGNNEEIKNFYWEIKIDNNGQACLFCKKKGVAYPMFSVDSRGQYSIHYSNLKSYGFIKNVEELYGNEE